MSLLSNLMVPWSHQRLYQHMLASRDHLITARSHLVGTRDLILEARDDRLSAREHVLPAREHIISALDQDSHLGDNYMSYHQRLEQLQSRYHSNIVL